MPTDVIINIGPLNRVETGRKQVAQQPLSTAKEIVMKELPEKLRLASLAILGRDVNSSQNVDDMIDSLNDLAQSVKHDIRFSVDREHDRVIIKVVDSETQELIRMIPPEEIVNLADVFAKHTGILLEASI